MGLKIEQKLTYRLENESASYELKNYRIELERQRAGDIQGTTEEPLIQGTIYLLSSGYDTTLDPVCYAECIDCRQVHDGLFEVDLSEPIYQLMQKKFFRSGYRETASEAMERIADSIGFSFVDETVPRLERFNSVFLSTVRNALDQIARVYSLDQQRWHLDLLKQKMYFLDGAKKSDPLEIPQDYFIEENDQGVEFGIIPNMRPHIPIKWRDKMWVIDRVIFEAKSNSMFLKLVDPTAPHPSFMPEQTLLMKRGFPGLGGYQSSYYFKVEKVHASAGNHSHLQPVASVDGHILTHDFKIDRSFEKLQKLPVYKSSAHIDDLPDVGNICLLEFPYWQSSTAVLKAVLYDGQDADVKENEVHIHNVKKIILNAINEIDLTTEGKIRIGSKSAELLTLFHETLQSQKKLLEKLNGTVAPAGTSFPGKLTNITADLTQLTNDNDAVIKKLNSIKK